MSKITYRFKIFNKSIWKGVDRLVELLAVYGIKLICACVVVILHELSKVVAMNVLVHPIYKHNQRSKFNIRSYIDPIGILSFMMLNVGWQKPVTINPNHLRDRKKGLIAIAFSGILISLLLTAVLIPIYLYVRADSGYFATAILILIRYNFSIAIINLLPIPPLDITKLIYALSPNGYIKLIQYEKVIHAFFILFLAMGFIGGFVESMFTPIYYILLG